MKITSINPATGEAINTYDETTPEEVASAVTQTHEVWQSWRRTTFANRAILMKKTAKILRERGAELAMLMAAEMGKPLKQGIAEVEKCAWACEYYAENAEAHLAPDNIKTEGSKSYVAFEPLGVVLAVMPWNFPLWQVFRFAAPALMAGNVGVLKHSSSVPGCALAVEEIFTEAGFPKGAFRTLLIPSGQVQSVIEHRFVRAVTLTGSTPAGKAVAAQAGAVLKKTVLELGGSAVCGARGCRPGPGRADMCQFTIDQLRSELHRGEAFHCFRADPCGVYREVCRAHEGQESRRSLC
jgi:succinate-semialdehyde dehydrogenase/glutarate-semialdehyde dehydrogenase